MKPNNNNKPCTCSAIQKCDMHRNSSMNQHGEQQEGKMGSNNRDNMSKQCNKTNNHCDKMNKERKDKK